MTLQSLAFRRGAVGFLQGFALYFLYQAQAAKMWPAAGGLIFASLLAMAVFVPTIIVAGLGNLRPRTLALWALLAAALCAGLAAYDIFSDPTGAAPTGQRLVPQPTTWFALAAILFILHSLVVAGDAERKIVASYSRYFDVAWKLGLQHVLAVTFLAVFWGLLWLGAILFQLIGIQAISQIILQALFIFPVSAMVFDSAVHITDIRAGIVRGTRTLVLTLLSWLLLMMTGITLAFFLALPFTGLEPLWKTRQAMGIILSIATALIFLINTAYQDGQADSAAATVLRYASAAAALVLMPLVALAGYGLLLRVQQYGWTSQRVIVLACVAVAAVYAVGYAVAALRSGWALRGLERTNVVAAYFIVAVVLALFTPLLDPTRVAVADQLNRLNAGKVSPDKFDYNFLRFNAGRYGVAALRELAARTEGPQAARIAERAKLALQARDRYTARNVAEAAQVTPQSRAANIKLMHPDGQPMPESFFAQNWPAQQPWSFPRCLTADAKCEALVTDIDGDGKPEILLFSLPSGPSAVFKLAGDGAWTLVGPMTNIYCAGVREGLRSGQFSAVAPPFKEIEVNGQRLTVTRGCTRPIGEEPPVASQPR
jgi:hypothetical protein